LYGGPDEACCDERCADSASAQLSPELASERCSRPLAEALHKRLRVVLLGSSDAPTDWS
jgi:hypothetical protein